MDPSLWIIAFVEFALNLDSQTLPGEVEKLDC